uniref:Potassium transport protein n=1 Tax=Blastobotrys adeninivorans TaxID=409370 RepID=A0A060T5Z8_BLAAD
MGWVSQYLSRLYHRKWSITFITYHYVYIIAAAIVGSILLYPLHNIRYIDALFLGSSMATQAGLATVNLNNLTLYQQIVAWIMPTITTPIFIHSFVVFLRLYWYEKKFSNIKENSKIQSRMRRTATFARDTSMDDYDIEMGMLHRSKLTGKKLKRAMTASSINSQDRGRGRLRSDDRAQSPFSAANTMEREHQGDGQVGPDQSSEQDFSSPPQRDIRFGNLPLPPDRHRKESVAPSDMYKSIAMMQKNRRQSFDSNEEGPALVIKGPQALDEENERLERLAKQGIKGPVVSPIVEYEDGSSSSKDVSKDEEDEEYDDEIRPYPGRFQRSQSDSGANVASNKDNNGFNMNRRAFTLEEKTGNTDADPIRGPKSLLRRGRRLSRSFTLDHMLSTARNKLRDRSESYDREPLQRTMTANYLSWEPTLGRNSNFIDLTQAQKEELGGVEYRALKLLAQILIAYYVGFHIIGVVLILPWAVRSAGYAQIIRESGITPVWWSFYTSQTSFNDLGFSMTPDSLQSFKNAPYLLLVSSFLIVIGNTGFPVMLRFIIWILFKITPKYGRTHESLGFLLDHPRRCFTMLFPSNITWLLFTVLVLLNGIDLVFFIILDLGNDYVADIPVGYRIICGLFQAFSTRTAGLQVLDVSQLHAAIQVSYVIMMYISVLPVAISIRRTNVYEEQALGVYQDGDNNMDDKNATSYVGHHLRRQLGHDMWYVSLGLFIICISESSRLNKDTDPAFDIFRVLFEVVSAYGTVGLSMGYPNTNPSFCGQFGVIGKLVIAALCIRGRHRGLPYALDRAVMMPSQRLERQDSIVESQAKKRRQSTSADEEVESPMFVYPQEVHKGASISSGVHRLRRMSMSSLHAVRTAGSYNSKPGPSDFKRQKTREDSPHGSQWLDVRKRFNSRGSQ